MVIDEEVLIHDLLMLSKCFYKIIEVNLNEDTYFEVKVNETNPKVYHKVQHWMDAFVSAGGVHPNDIDSFNKFFNLQEIKKNIQNPQKLYYRRRINNEWRCVCMEIVPLDNYTDEDAIVLILVRDVEDYVKIYKEQFEMKTSMEDDFNKQSNKGYTPVCPAGAEYCILDPAYIKYKYPDWYKSLYEDKTPKEAMDSKCCWEKDEYDGCENYDDEDK